MTFHPIERLVGVLSILSVLCSVCPAREMYDLPLLLEPVQKAVSAENLSKVADATEDADVLIGLAELGPVKYPQREALLARAAKIKPAYSSIAAAVVVMTEGAGDANVARLIERDPENALGYYLRADLLYQQKQDAPALEAYDKATKCRDLRLYEAVRSQGVLKALDALKLQGRERVYVLSWFATRWANWLIIQIQPLHNNLSELARRGELAQRGEIADKLLVLAGHLYRTNFNNRAFGERALQDAFRLKAEVAAAENSPRMYGYAAVTQALVSTMYQWPEISSGQDLQRVAPFVAGRIYRAFQIVQEGGESKGEKVNLAGPARAAYDKARKDQVKAAEALIAAAMENPDEIVGAYLRGMLQRKQDAKEPWVSQLSYVEQAMSRHPGVFKAALANEEAMDAVNRAQRSDPRQQNISRMMEVAGAAVAYSFKHGSQLPASLDVLLKEKYLDPGDEIKSVITGRPYVFAGANQKLPERREERFGFIVLYDDHVEDGNQQAAVAIPGGITLSAEELKTRLEKQKK
ncbi:MAG TPA: hypothetical protein VF669_15750 [Tepidisphaeraceae bacterium]